VARGAEGSHVGDSRPAFPGMEPKSEGPGATETPKLRPASEAHSADRRPAASVGFDAEHATAGDVRRVELSVRAV
jgi:hypothetical protein